MNPSVPPSIKKAEYSKPLRQQSAKPQNGNFNPLDRMTKQLLKFDFIEAINDARSNLSVLSLEEGAKSPMRQLPNTFASYIEYIKLWEPLLINEIQETIVSNFIKQDVRNIPMGKVTAQENEQKTTPELVNLTCSFLNPDMKEEM